MRGRLLIVRGLPGSGKSTYVRNNYPGIFTMETDMFNTSCGQYQWTIDRSKECIRLIKKFLNELYKSKNSPDICLTGVFGRLISFYNYIDGAIINKYDVYIKTLTTQYGNIHSVPLETMINFKNNFLPHDKLMEMLRDDANIRDHIFDIDMPPINWKFDDRIDTQSENNNYTGEG
jgi:hypothetical protein